MSNLVPSNLSFCLYSFVVVVVVVGFFFLGGGGTRRIITLSIILSNQSHGSLVLPQF